MNAPATLPRITAAVETVQTIPLVTEQVVDLLDGETFPEVALALARAAALRARSAS